MTNEELYISVDIETSGPIPGEFSMLSIGACLVFQPETSFYLELKPVSMHHDPEALAVSGFSLEELDRKGIAPLEAMRSLEKWVVSCCAEGQDPVFVGLNAPFDWSFVNYYFHKYIGNNPFGFTAIDMKAYFMGAFSCNWKETKSSNLVSVLKPLNVPSHNALADARFQAELFALMLTLQKIG